MNVSLTPELREAVQRRVHSGMYGNASDVLRAGLRALERKEIGEAWREWQTARRHLPREPINCQIEEKIEERIRQFRQRRKRKS